MWGKEYERLALIYTAIKQTYTNKGLWFPSFHEWLKKQKILRSMNYTSIEQSKMLIEAGLDPKTADMLYYPYVWDDNHPKLEDFKIPPLDRNYVTTEHSFKKSAIHNSIPCWSLGALISLLPDVIETKKSKNIWFPSILPASNGVCYEGMDGNENKITFLKIFSTGTDNNDNTLLDNMVKMISWLLENNYIKKGKTK